MIRHLVIWSFKESALGATREENIERAARELRALPALISEIRSLEVGVNVQPGGDAGALALNATFDSMEALQRYAVHPEHKRVAEFLSQVRTSRTVIDYEL